MSRAPRVVLVDVDRRDDVRASLSSLGLWSRSLSGSDGSAALLLDEHGAAVAREALLAVPGVRAVLDEESPCPRVDAHGPTLTLGDLEVGRGTPVLAAGPCAVESEEAIHRLAAEVARRGARILRGGAYKPRTSPYTFRGHGAHALTWLDAAARAHGLKVCTEVIDVRDVERVARVADLVQVGARSMQNGPLLRAIGETGRPALLKRAPDATVSEWLHAAEALLDAGARGVVFCERGGKTPERGVRNALDVSAIALVAARGLPVAVDPSHAAGRRDMVLPLAAAGVAAGASLVLVEVHDAPGEARSDGPQAITPLALSALASRLGISVAESPES